MSSSYAIDAIEYRMSVSLKQTIKILKKNDDSISELLASHFLKGSFLKLSNPKIFRELLFPGLTNENIYGIPKNMKEILSWDQILINEKKVIKSAKEVLHNIKAKGPKDGKVMDEQTEMVLLPQIVQEALANHIIDLVRALNRRVSNTVAQLSQRIASADCPDANRNQLDPSSTITSLSNSRFASQSKYLGSDWAELLSKDCSRFCHYEKLTKFDCYGNMIIAGIDTDNDQPSSSSLAATEICWIELDEYLQRYYPVMSVLLDQLYALPHELNAKYIWDGPSFLEVSRGCTMLVRYPAGASQAMRLDCRANNLKFDSGLRMTAIYHFCRKHDEEFNLVETMSSSPSPYDGKMIFSSASVDKQNTTDGKGRGKAEKIVTSVELEKSVTITIENDMLTLHHSTDIKNERTSCDEEWFALICFIHGKLS